MKSKDPNVLSLPPLPPDPGINPDLTQAGVDDSSTAIQGLQTIHDDKWRQKFLMNSIAGRTRPGLGRMLELNEYASTIFEKTAQAISRIHEEE